MNPMGVKNALLRLLGVAQRLKAAAKHQRALFCASLVAMLAFPLLVWSGASVFSARGEFDARQQFIAFARAAVVCLPTEDIQQLRGIAQDLETPAYARAKSMLCEIRSADQRLRFAYLQVLRNDQIQFLVDAEPVESPDFSPPGQVYSEESPELRQSFRTGRAFVEGPYRDRWGEWVTAHAPIRDSKTGEIVAMLGVDIDASHWKNTIAIYRWLGIILTAFPELLAGVFLVAYLHVRRSKSVLEAEIIERKRIEANMRLSEEKLAAAYEDVKAGKLELEGAYQQLKSGERELATAYTSLQKQEHNLRQSETQYRQLIENANSIILQMTTDGSVTFFNDYAQRFFGYSVEEILGKNVVGAIVPETDLAKQNLRKMIVDLATGPGAYATSELENIRRNGERVCIAWSNQAIRDLGGKVVGVLCVGNDITSQRLIEEEQIDTLMRTHLQQAGIARIAMCYGMVNGDLDEAVRTITEASCDTLDVERTSVWVLDDLTKELQCVDVFHRNRASHERGLVFRSAMNPTAFDSLRNARVVDAAHAQTDARTSRFNDLYLVPNHINSLLAVPIRRSGEFAGIVCFEHVGPTRIWRADEITFAGTVGDQGVQALLSHERTVADKALRESEGRYRALFDTANDGILIIDNENYIDCNPKALELFGCAKEDIFGKNPLHFSPKRQPNGGDSRESALEKLSNALAGRPQFFEWRHCRPDGLLFDVEVGLNRIELSGRVLLLAIVRDVTERKRSEAERLRLTSAIEHVAENIIITDTNGTVQYVNPAFERTTGYTRQEMIGQNTRILKSGKHTEDFYRELWSTLRRGDLWSGRLINKRKDGSLLEEEVTIAPVRDCEGQTTHFVAVRRDITREAKLEIQLRQAQKMEAIGTLAGGIAHDFNNILQAVLGYTELVETELSEQVRVASYLQGIRAAANRARDLVHQILAFSRQADQERKPIKIQPIAKEVMKLLRGSLPATIEMRHSIDANVGPIIADPTEIHQVMMNLATNAYHAMKDHGGVLELALNTANASTLSPAALKPGDYACLTVKDTGQGMDSTTMERIFEPYFTTKKKGEGTGLGLATVHGIVKSLDGEVTVQSQLGKGCVFTVFLPLAELPRHSTETNKADTLEPSAPMGCERILLVDDEEPLVRSGRLALELLGYHVTSHANAYEALEAFRAAPDAFDLVITDQTMPKLTGIELAKEMLCVRPNLPIILYTGHSDTVDEQIALAAGIKDFVMKPIAFEELAHVVRRVHEACIDSSIEEAVT